MFADQSISLDEAVAQGVLADLETFPCPYSTKQAHTGAIRIVFPEFTCVCPRTGYPDFGAIHLYYLPDRKCVELKSWKLFLNSFRMVGTFHEAVTSFVFETVQKVLAPKWLLIAGDFFPRGNVDTTVVFESPGPRPTGVDTLLTELHPHSRSFEK